MKPLCFSGLILLIHGLFAQVSIRTIHVDNKHQPCPMAVPCAVSFPVISTADKLVETQINNALMDEFGDRDRNDQVFENVFISMDDSNNAAHFLVDLQYEVLTNNSHLLSMKLEGGAQGAYYSPFSACRNFDLHTGYSPQLIELFSVKYYIELADRIRNAKQKAIRENLGLLATGTDTDIKNLEWLKEEDENWLRYCEPEDYYFRNGDLYLEDDARKTYPHYLLTIMPSLDTLRTEGNSLEPHLTNYGKYISGHCDSFSIPLVKKQFRGSLGKSMDIKLAIMVNNDAWNNNKDQPVEGYYFDTGLGQLIYARGHTNGKIISLDIYDQDYKPEEKFEGKIYHINGTETNEPAAPAVINGNWTDLRTGQTRNFYIQESYY